MEAINFLDIYYSLLSFKPDVLFSYLTADELLRIYNTPIKEQTDIYFTIEDYKEIKNNHGIGLIIMTNTGNTLNNENSFPKYNNFEDALKDIPGIILKEHNRLNKKMAAVLSGLGQYGKNQLIYNYSFGFEHTLNLYVIYNKVFNLPIRHKPNFQLLDLCTNCNLCEQNCPAKAIHASCEGPMWLDKESCRDFFNFSDHEYISSTKYGINAFLGYPFSNEQLKKVQDPKSFEDLFGFEYYQNHVIKDGEKYHLNIKYCRECMNQLPCRKRIQQYDKNFFEILPLKEYNDEKNN